MKEGVAGAPVEIGEFSHELLAKILDFMYSGKIEIGGEEVMAILQFGDMYDVTPLRVVCGESLYRNMRPTVAMETWNLARQFSADELAEKCKSYCLDKFAQITVTQGFLEADAETVAELLKQADLNVPDENAVFNALYDWLMYEKESRAEYMDRLFSDCIHAHTLDPQACRANEMPIGGIFSRVKDALWTFIGGFIGSLFNALLIHQQILKSRRN